MKVIYTRVTLAAIHETERLIEIYRKHWAECLALSAQEDLSEVDHAIFAAQAGVYEGAITDLQRILRRLHGGES